MQTQGYHVRHAQTPTRKSNKDEAKRLEKKRQKINKQKIKMTQNRKKKFGKIKRTHLNKG